MSIEQELEQIRENNNGLLRPRSVVDFARDEGTELHSKFEWDDSLAGENYRIWQARKIITAMVTIIPRKNEPIEVQTYVSMINDRYAKGSGDEQFVGGYRSIIEVLKTPDLRRSLLQEAMDEHEIWEKKYQTIVELVDIFNAAKTVKQKLALQPEPISV